MQPLLLQRKLPYSLKKKLKRLPFEQMKQLCQICSANTLKHWTIQSKLLLYTESYVNVTGLEIVFHMHIDAIGK